MVSKICHSFLLLGFGYKLVHHRNSKNMTTTNSSLLVVPFHSQAVIFSGSPCFRVRYFESGTLIGAQRKPF